MYFFWLQGYIIVIFYFFTAQWCAGPTPRVRTGDKLYTFVIASPLGRGNPEIFIFTAE